MMTREEHKRITEELYAIVKVHESENQFKGLIDSIINWWNKELATIEAKNTKLIERGDIVNRLVWQLLKYAPRGKQREIERKLQELSIN